MGQVPRCFAWYLVFDREWNAGRRRQRERNQASHTQCFGRKSDVRRGGERNTRGELEVGLGARRGNGVEVEERVGGRQGAVCTAE